MQHSEFGDARIGHLNKGEAEMLSSSQMMIFLTMYNWLWIMINYQGFTVILLNNYESSI
jgi:hypothetical protein